MTLPVLELVQQAEALGVAVRQELFRRHSCITQYNQGNQQRPHNRFSLQHRVIIQEPFPGVRIAR
jgi:hypothetical protein